MAEADTTAHMSATRVPLMSFREILLVPLALEWRHDEGRGAQLAIGSDLANAAADALSVPWEPVEDRLLHLREDRAAAPDDRGARAVGLAAAYEEFVYFEPYVQRFLYGNGEAEGGRSARAPIRLFARDDIVGLDVELAPDDPPPDDQPAAATAAASGGRRFRFLVTRCNLYVFDTGNVFLVVEIELDLAGSAAVSLGDAQQLLESVRRVFPPYFKAGEGSDGAAAGLHARYFPATFRWRTADEAVIWPGTDQPDAVAMIEHVVGAGERPRRGRRTPPMFEPWRRLLEPLAIEGYEPAGSAARSVKVVLSQMGDDRAFVLAQVGVPDPSVISPADWVRLCFADAPAEGSPYGAAILEGFDEKHCYDRFWDDDPKDWKKVRYLACGYAVVVVGKETPFFRETISKHVRRQYFQLVLVSCFQKAALLTLSERLADAIDTDERRKSSARFRDDVHRIARDSYRFTHRYWFEDISAQLQAAELFDLLRRHLRTRELHHQVVTELGDADRFLGTEEQEDMARQQGRLNIIASVGLAAAVTVGIFGMNVFAPGDELFGPVTWKQVALWGAGTGTAFWLVDELSRRIGRGFGRWVLLAFPAALAAILICLGIDWYRQ